MGETITWVIIVNAVWVGLATLCVKAAYNNGVNDGYGYSREPFNPGYEKAGEYLRKFCTHRWPEVNK